jgi:hypothetical protein
MALGVAALEFLDDGPAEAAWLAQESRAWLSERIRSERELGASSDRRAERCAQAAPSIGVACAGFLAASVASHPLLRVAGLTLVSMGALAASGMCLAQRRRPEFTSARGGA